MRKQFIPLLFFFCANTLSGQMATKVMTFNIRYDNPVDGEYGWKRRLPLVKEVMQQEQPDIIGLQEVLNNQAEDLQKVLPGYKWSGVGRDDGKEKGEYAPIFFRSSRFEMKEGSTFWLSEIPEVPGSRSWNAACTRIVTWVKLNDKKSKHVFFVFNTHFDHASQSAREQSAKLLLLKITEIAGTSAVILTGDFNDTLNSIPVRTLTSGPAALENTLNLSSSSPEGPDYSFAGFPFHPEKGDVIDFIFLRNKGGITVTRHSIITFHKEDKYPSDHLPVCVELEFPTP
ncbi:MAG: endonuclease/exonuclease/phosphatase family protein [Bacteroidetes bacterium]|nr:endonuclease/exonuclease/phosphatase family protein [Bacteroidota bacterium]